jgi:hypothetical protein
MQLSKPTHQSDSGLALEQMPYQGRQVELACWGKQVQFLIEWPGTLPFALFVQLFDF